MSRLTMTNVACVQRAARTLGLGGALALGAAVASGCVEQAEDKPTAEDLEFVKQHLLGSPPAPQFAVNGDIGGKVVYLGLDTSMNPIEPGKDVKITQYWKVVEAPGAGWRLFMHANGPGGESSFQNFDHGPVRNKYSVSQWKAGDIIRDEHTIRLPPTYPHDRVEIYAGLWKGAERMEIRSGQKDKAGRLLAASIPVKGKAPAERKRYVARKASKPIKLDGKLDDAAWKDAPSTGAFVDTMTGGEVPQKTEAKVVWDKDNLYLAFDVTDKDVWSKFDKRDDKLWQQEAIEIMIDADKNGRSYVEFQVAPTGAMFDTYLPEYRKYEPDLDPKRKPFDWNSKMKAVVKVDGTLNKREDQDKGWVVEIAIPLADVNGLATEGVKVPPAVGDTWRINMFRMEAPDEKRQEASGWSPPLVGDFHALDKFGEIVFGDEKGAVPTAHAEAAPAAGDPRAAALKDSVGGAQQPGAPGGTLKAEGKSPAEKAPGEKKMRAAKREKAAEAK